MPMVVARFVEGRKTHSTKPCRMERWLVGKERSKVVGMKFAQDFHLTTNFMDGHGVPKLIGRMMILPMFLDPFHDGKREIAMDAINTKRGDSKEGG